MPQIKPRAKAVCLKRKLHCVVLLLLTPLFLPLGCAVKEKTQATETKFTILHTNDVHAGYGGRARDGRICYASYCEGGKGGSVRMLQATAAIRQEAAPVLLLDAGDQTQGSLYSTEHGSAIIKDTLDSLGYQAFVPGNHDFDNGCDALLDLAKNMRTPIIAANFNFAPSLKGAPSIAPWLITQVAGRKVGIVGLTNPETPILSTPCKEARFTAPEPALRAAVTTLSKEGVDIIVVLSHLGFGWDKELARSISGVDIIVGGHSHSLLSNARKDAVGPYPVVERSPSGDTVLVVTAYYGGEMLGRLNVTFDERGVARQWSGDALTLNDATLVSLNAPKPDPVFVKKMEKYSVPVQKLLNEPLGSIEISGFKDGLAEGMLEADIGLCRQGECLSGNIVADAMLSVKELKAEIALFNGGTLRNPLPVGQVSRGDVLGALPFHNTLSVVALPGKVIRQALEHGLANYDKGSGAFLQAAGLRYQFNLNKKPGQRVGYIAVQDKNGQWQPLNSAAQYRVVTLNYLTDAGDGFSMLGPFNWLNSELLLSSVVEQYIEQNSRLRPRLEGRITSLK